MRCNGWPGGQTCPPGWPRPSGRTGKGDRRQAIEQANLAHGICEIEPDLAAENDILAAQRRCKTGLGEGGGEFRAPVGVTWDHDGQQAGMFGGEPTVSGGDRRRFAGMGAGREKCNAERDRRAAGN